jgi:hypothetical protein
MVDERGPCPRPSKACGLTTEEIAPGFTGIEVATEMPGRISPERKTLGQEHNGRRGCRRYRLRR